MTTQDPRDLPLAKPQATQIARNLARALERDHGLKLGHQAAMAVLGQALGFSAQQEFAARLKADRSAQTPPALAGTGIDEMIAEIRRRGHFAMSVPPEHATKAAGLTASMAEDPDFLGWFQGTFDSLQNALAMHAQGHLRALAVGGVPGPAARPAPEADRSQDTCDLPHEPFDPQNPHTLDERGDRALDQCTRRGIEIGSGKGGIFWQAPDESARRDHFSSARAAALDACAHYGIDPDDPCVENHYSCPDCAEAWSDTWYCACNDKCPSCGAEIEPQDSEDLFEEMFPRTGSPAGTDPQER